MVDIPHIQHLLVVDDEMDSANVLAALLRLLLPHWDVAVTYSGSAAVKCGRRGPLEAVVLDIEMPGLDGLGAAAALRAAAQQTLPVLIAVSGNPSKVAAARASHVFDHALLKPVDVMQLKALCELA